MANFWARRIINEEGLLGRVLGRKILLGFLENVGLVLSSILTFEGYIIVLFW